MFELANNKNAVVRVHMTTVGDKIYTNREGDSGELTYNPSQSSLSLYSVLVMSRYNFYINIFIYFLLHCAK